MQKMYLAGALHDIGKVAIGNEILEKPGKLTDEEFKAVASLFVWLSKRFDFLPDIKMKAVVAIFQLPLFYLLFMKLTLFGR